MRQRDEHVEVETRGGEVLRARGVMVAVPLNTLGGIEFDPPLSERKREGIALGQASRGIKLFVRVSGRRSRRPCSAAASVRIPRHRAAARGREPDPDRLRRRRRALRRGDLARVQREMDEIMPGYVAIDAAAHDWLADEFARGTWAIHRPGWYTRYHEEMRRPEGRVLLAGSDFANGWSGFIDGAIESGLQAGASAPRLIA